MKTIKTEVVQINGKFNIYADEQTKKFQNYCDLAAEKNKDWTNMSKRAKSNFRKRNAHNLKDITKEIKVFEVVAKVPTIFGEAQLKNAAINYIALNRTQGLFLECKNGKTGWSTNDFEINLIKVINNSFSNGKTAKT